MTESELIATGYYAGLALSFSIVVIAGLGLMLQVDRFVGRWVAFLVVPAMGLGTALSSALSGRDLKFAYNNIDLIAIQSSSSSTNVLRLITVIVVATCLATVIANLFRRVKSQAGTQRLPGQSLYVAFTAFYLFNVIFNSAFGTVPSFSHNVLYVFVVFTAIYIWREIPVKNFVDWSKLTLMLFMLGSLLVAALKPSLAVEPNYKGWISFLSFRLWGLGSHANSLGSLALLLLLLEWMQPSRGIAVRLTIIASATLVLLLAQSKTAWIVAATVIPILAWYRIGRAPSGGTRIGFALASIIVLLILVVGLSFVDLERIWYRIAISQAGSDITTLSGRGQIWAVAIDAWSKSPLFGYGPTAWGPAHRAAIGMPFAFSAHNQFLQALSSAGVMGLISLLFYLSVLAVYSIRAAETTAGVSIALFLFILIRCVTETPLLLGVIFNGDTIAHLLLFRIILSGGPDAPKENIIFLQNPQTTSKKGLSPRS